ncbi:2-oxo acid dehydrogenase subunit E2 [Halomicroarcula sp. GCM10025709]|uniref:2-oxo acid dehydrogenase subunit E2 n=1 Tax=Haloarcula TaxID=2237 RepID=UPI0024C37279|nr:2-oxo acid dehydrogenase subunit E2 [Halomicroarcula sp. YJ-61-S]
MSDRTDRIEPRSARRRGTVDYMRAAGRRSNVHGLVEVDVTEARRRIEAIEAETGTAPSFTAFLVCCLARAIEDHPGVNAYRDWRGRVHVFRAVDVNVLVETTVDGERMGVPHVVRRANERSLRSIHDEIRAAQDAEDPTALSRWAELGLRLPGFVRRLVWRLPQWLPERWTDVAGTVAVTSVGMFGAGGGWAISPTNYTLQLTVGGIGERPAFVDGTLAEREILNLTVTVDHDIVDGGAAARFVNRLCELIEDAHGLEPQADGHS